MTPEVNLAYYREEDWERLLESIDDLDSMHDTWKEWHNAYLNAKVNLVLEEFTVNDCVVDIDELQTYCKRKGLKNDGKARSQFVQSK